MGLGRIVGALRAAAGFSQESFSALVDVHRTYMGSLERGRVNPSLETLHRLAQGLGMSAWELLKMAETKAASREPVTPITPPRRPDVTVLPGAE